MKARSPSAGVIRLVATSSLTYQPTDWTNRLARPRRRRRLPGGDGGPAGCDDRAGRDPRGATVSAVTSVSMSPAMLLVCLDARSDTLAALHPGRRFLVHVAADGLQEAVMRFAGKGAEKFDTVAWTADADGQPLIAGAGVVFRCVAESLQQAGDHTVVIGGIVGIEHDPTRRPVVYHRRTLLPTPVTR
jgi:flavin reductase (DIM6/NTAB) family NADH-FMN oxidoreductase RutF